MSKIKCFVILLLVCSSSFVSTLAAQEKEPVFNGAGKPIIQVFGNFDLNLGKDHGKRYGFWIGRAHFGYEHQFSEQFSGRIVLDVGRPTLFSQFSEMGGYKEGSYYSVTLKFASLEWMPNEHIRIQAGSILQNHYITQEKFWGYRYLAPTFQDKYFGTPSGDLGIIGYFKVNEFLGLDLALTNGEGFRFDQDLFGDVKLAAGIDINPLEGLQGRFFYDYTQSNNPLKPADQQLFSGFIGYRHKKIFRAGGEYNYHKNHLNRPGEDIYGFSLFGSVSLFPNIELFARFDKVMANNIENKGNAYITGLHYSPVKGIHLSLNYQGWDPENGTLAYQHHLLLSFEYKL